MSYRLSSRGEGILPFTTSISADQSAPAASISGKDSDIFNTGSIPEGILAPWDGAGRVTVLVMGLDYRDWSAGDGPSRTDTMMLLTLDPLNQLVGSGAGGGG